MRIKELYIENFGKLSAYRQSFSDGLNAFCNDNGYGKTTLTVFIKAMLYGLEDTRRQNLSENDRKKYLPWQGGAFGGWLTFEARGKTYRIERTFAQKASDDKFALYNLDTGMPSDDFPDNVGEALFGIDADGFERTVFLSEKNIGGKNENPTISAKLSNLVGVEGDIGGFDEAIDLLDKRRKFYQKKGGSGEIRELQRRLAEAEEELAALDFKSELCKKNERLLSELSDKIKVAKKKKETLLEKQRSYALIKEKESYGAQYRQMLRGQRAEEERRDNALKFFSRKLPTDKELYEASSNLSEAERLERAHASVRADEEFSSLAGFFAPGTSYEECDEMVEIARTLEKSEAAELSSKRTDIPSPFVRIPTEDEIEAASKRLGRGGKGTLGSRFIPLTLLGVIILAVGLVLANAASAALYALAAVGAVITAVGIAGSVASSSKKTESSVSDFIAEVYGDGYRYDGELSALITMRAELERYKAELLRKERTEAEMRNASAAISHMRERLGDFLSKFPTNAPSLLEKVYVIQRKYQRYRFLEESASRSEEERREHLKRSASLRRKAEDFIALFPTVTDDPLGEIRSRLSELEVLHASAKRRAEETKAFAEAHGICESESPISHTADTCEELAGEISSADEELIGLERQKSLTESEHSSLSREIEARPVLEERLLELKEKIGVYEENLAVIQKTKELLSAAKTNMTAKYLDGTQRGFDKYMSLIEGEGGEFSMDTSFTVMKSDFGASRQAEAYSRGTRDLHSLAVRLALVDALYENDLPPIILDDPFTAFDDYHTERALATLKKIAHERQIIYFTCSKSRKAK